MNKEFLSTLKDLKLNKKKDNFGNERYYLSVTYHVDESHKSYDITYPRIELPLVGSPSIKTECKCNPLPYRTIDLGFGDCELGYDEDGRFAYRTNVVEKAEKMTLSEIEEKLGHKIELVSEKE